ncbi:hypothetical protein PINS_up003932 [Pythium insidiosum]|nr:hypothetical protein PINS_up003932 [Pythium insidiosum]
MSSSASSSAAGANAPPASSAAPSPSGPPPSSSSASGSPSFLFNVAGVPVDLGASVHVATKKQLQRQINAIVGWNELDRAPLTLPQSFVRGNDAAIGEQNYFVSEVSVGVRYLIVLVSGHCYLVTPNYDIREVSLFSPVRPDRLQPGVDRNTIVPHQWTILDGLLVCDRDPMASAKPSGGASTLTMVVNDILALNGTPVLASKLQDRLKLIQNDVIGPRKQIPMPKGQPPDQFQLVQQFMYPVTRVSHVIRNIIPRVNQTRQNTGLVFTPVTLPYTPGYAKGLYTWTPTMMLTVDFQLGVEWRGRPPKPGFKLIVHDKRSQVFHDWITFSPEDFEVFRSDKKASSRIVECVYDPEWLTFIPSHDKLSWDVGNPDFVGLDRGQGWRKGGWRFVRCRMDRAMPIERSYLAVIEKAIGEDVRIEEIEQLFPDDPAKKVVAPQPKSRDPPTAQEEFPPSKKKRGVGPGTGVCYDFQNKGVCQRGRFCHFSHCACNSTCSCTPTKNTYGQRPAYRRNDYDAPPSPDMPPGTPGDPSVEKPQLLRGTSVDRDITTLKPEPHLEEEEAGELTDLGNLNLTNVYAPLESFDKEALAAKRAQLTALSNRRIWTSLGLEDKGGSRKRTCGLIVSKSGEITVVRASEK